MARLRDHLRHAKPYVAIAGPAGCGKTRLAEALAEHFAGRSIDSPRLPAGELAAGTIWPGAGMGARIACRARFAAGHAHLAGRGRVGGQRFLVRSIVGLRPAAARRPGIHRIKDPAPGADTDGRPTQVGCPAHRVRASAWRSLHRFAKASARPVRRQPIVSSMRCKGWSVPVRAPCWSFRPTIGSFCGPKSPPLWPRCPKRQK